MTDLSPLYRGDSRELSLTFTDGNGDPIDISLWKVYFTLKENEGDSDDNAKLKKDVTVHTTPLEGNTTVSLLPADTNDLDPRTYHYDIQVKKNGGVILTVVKGKLQILSDITRRVS